MSSIDKLFQEKIKEHSMPYSKDLWGKIDAEINPVKEKNRILPFLFFALAALLVAGSFFWTQSGSDSELLGESIVTNEQGDSEKPGQSSSLLATDTENTEQSKSLKTEPFAIDFENGKDTSTEKIKSTNDSSNRNSLKKSNLHSTKVIKKNAVKKEYESLKSNVKESVLNNTANFTSNDLGNFKQAQFTNQTDEKKSSSIGLRKDVLSSSSINKLVRTNDHIDYIQYLNFTPKPLLSKSLDQDVSMPCSEYNNTNCEDLYVLKSGWFAEVYFTSEYAIRKLRAKTPEYIDYKNIRNDSELSLFSFSTGIRAQYLSSKGVSFKTGINYSQINEVYRFTDPESGRYKDVIVRDEVTGQVIDSITYYIPGEERVRTQNRYKMLDIPVIVGFESLRTNKLSYSVNAGVYFNLLFRQRGQFMDPDSNSDVWFTSNEEGAYKAYKNQIGLSYFTSVGAIYHWSDQWDVFADVSMRFYPDSFSNDDYFLIQKYTVVGLNTGLRYKF